MLVWLLWLQRIISGSFVGSDRWTHGRITKVTQGKLKLWRSFWCVMLVLTFRRIQGSIKDEKKKKFVTGEWFSEVKAKRFQEDLEGPDLLRASIRRKKGKLESKYVSIHLRKTNWWTRKKIGPGWESPCTGSLLRTSPWVVIRWFSSMFSVLEKHPLLSKSGPKEKNYSVAEDQGKSHVQWMPFPHFSFFFFCFFFPIFLFARGHWYNFLLQR